MLTRSLCITETRRTEKNRRTEKIRGTEES